MHNFSKHSYIFKFTTVGAVALAIFTAISGLLLSAPHASASDTSSTIDFSLQVIAACSLSATSGSDLYTTINAGDTSLIGTTSLKAVCNDNGGLAIYAGGYTGNSYGDTNLRRQEAGTLSTTNLIPTGVSLSTSYWNMTVTENTSVQSSYSPVIPVAFQSAHAVPSSQTKIASYSSTTDQTAGINVNVAYNVHAALDQPAGVYKGKIKFLLVHPNTAVSTLDTIYTMQSVAQWGSNVGRGETVKAADERDGEVYTVARLADNKLWMTKNLRLNIATASITADNTNNPSSAFVTYAADPTKNAAENGPWCNSGTSACINQIRYSIASVSNSTVDQNGHKYDEYGVYYNWYTATAGNGTYNSGYGFTSSGDICPSGWRLPTGIYNNNEYVTLDIALGGDGQNHSPSGNEGVRWKASPVNILLGGYYRGNDGLYDAGTAAQYHTANSASQDNEYIFHLSPTGLGFYGTVTNKYNGLTIRCVSDQ